MKQIAKKLNQIMSEIGYVQKDGINDHQKYRYVSEAGLIDKLRPIMVKHGVVAIPTVVDDDTVEIGATKFGTMQYRTRVVLETQFIDCESGESITVRHIGHGVDTGDKGSYKATTGANKYTLFKTFQIATGDDPEKDSPEVEKDTKPISAKPELIKNINKALEVLEDKNIAFFDSREAVLEHLFKFTGVQDTTLLFKADDDKLKAYLTELRRIYKDGSAA